MFKQMLIHDSQADIVSNIKAFPLIIIDKLSGHCDLRRWLGCECITGKKNNIRFRILVQGCSDRALRWIVADGV
jgi:hypothetical protein